MQKFVLHMLLACCFYWVDWQFFQISNFIWLIYRIRFITILTFREGTSHFPGRTIKTWEGNTSTASILNLHEVTFLMILFCCIKKVKSLLSVRVFGKITEKSKSDFDLSTLTATKFGKWLNLFRRILKSIFLSPHWSKSLKSLSLYRHNLFNAK